jgi:hypothetical protein
MAERDAEAFAWIALHSFKAALSVDVFSKVQVL